MKSRTKTALWLGLGVAGMICLTFAFVPLYRAFCEATGFNGTARKAISAPKSTDSTTVLKVRFDTNTNGIDWKFISEQSSVSATVGKTAIAYFKVTNLSNKDVTGRASYNVLPEEMGGYFMKLQCFCFTEQTLKAGETKEFPVVFYIDPLMLENVDTRKVRDVTLSYTFFESKTES